MFLHIEYYFKNKNDALIIDVSKAIIIINNQPPISFSEIDKIVYVMPPIWHRKGFIRLLSFEDYHYAKIKMKTGKKFLFTSLMGYNVQAVLEQINGVTIEKRKVLFATTLIG